MDSNDPNRFVRFSFYMHGDDDAIWNKALSAGITQEELGNDFVDLMYIGYEIRVDVEVDRLDKKFTVKYDID